jgi:hypothetical protein
LGSILHRETGLNFRWVTGHLYDASCHDRILVHHHCKHLIHESFQTVADVPLPYAFPRPDIVSDKRSIDSTSALPLLRPGAYDRWKNSRAALILSAILQERVLDICASDEVDLVRCSSWTEKPLRCCHFSTDPTRTSANLRLVDLSNFMRPLPVRSQAADR